MTTHVYHLVLAYTGRMHTKVSIVITRFLFQQVHTFQSATTLLRIKIIHTMCSMYQRKQEYIGYTSNCQERISKVSFSKSAKRSSYTGAYIASITKTRLFKYIETFMSKTENFQIKSSDIFHISAQKIHCGYSLEPPRRGNSNEYPQSMFSSRNKKNNEYSCKPQFYYIKVGFEGVKII